LGGKETSDARGGEGRGFLYREKKKKREKVSGTRFGHKARKAVFYFKYSDTSKEEGGEGEVSLCERSGKMRRNSW